METSIIKKALRKEIAAKKKEHTKEELNQLSDMIMQRLEQDKLFQAASCVALYHALPGEVQTAHLIDKWHQQKRLLLPLIVGDDLKLLLYEGPQSVQIGQYGILEPKPCCKEISEKEIDLIIVPGVAFDKEKNRMGRGKGFYDRLLSTLNCPKIGVCFDFQITPNVPVEPFDKKMDYVITESTQY